MFCVCWEEPPVQNQKAVTAYVLIKQLPPFGFALQSSKAVN